MSLKAFSLSIREIDIYTYIYICVCASEICHEPQPHIQGKKSLAKHGQTPKLLQKIERSTLFRHILVHILSMYVGVEVPKRFSEIEREREKKKKEKKRERERECVWGASHA